MALADHAVRRPIATSMLWIAALLFGVVALPRLDVTLLPDVRPDRLEVWIGYPNADVEELEQSVVRPVEDALASVRGVRNVRSDIVPGGAGLTLVLYPGSDSDLVTLGVRERLDTLRWRLPDGIDRPVILGHGTDDEPDMVLAVASDDLVSAAEWARTVLRPRLEQIDGVARAALVGEPEREVRITPNTVELEARGVSVSDIARAVRDANVDVPGGYLRRRETRFALEIDSRLQTAADVAAVAVQRAGDRLVRVDDVAEVTDGFADVTGLSRLDGKPAIGVLLSRESRSNLVRMSRRVHERLAEIHEEFPDFTVAVVSDPAPFVKSAISGVWQSVWVGGLLAYLVLILFLRDLRTPLLLMIALPASIIPTFAILDALHVSLNLMSLGGVALGVGMLVDNAIICLENIHRLRAEGDAPLRSAARGANEVSMPMLASTLTTCAVFAPLAWVHGPIGALFRDQAVSVTVSLLMSFLVAITLLPMLASRFAPSRPRDGHLPLFSLYHRWLGTAIRRPGFVCGLAVLLSAGGVAVLRAAPRELLPDVASGLVEVEVTLPTGTIVAATDEAAREIDAWLASRSDVEERFTTVGTATALRAADRARAHNRALVRARLTDAADERRMRREIHEAFAARDGWRVDVRSAQRDFSTFFESDEPSLQAEVVGPRVEESERIAAAIRDRAASSLNGLGAQLTLSAGEREPRVRIALDEAMVARRDLSSAEITDAFTALGGGLEAARIRRFDDEHPVVIRHPDATDIGTATVVASGRAWPVRALATVATELAPARVLRDNQARLAAVQAWVALRNVPAVWNAVRAAAVEVGLPEGYSLREGGAYLDMRDTLRAIARAFALSAGLVLLVLAAQFESVRFPLVVFAAVPLAAVGVAIAILLSRGSVNAVSGMGAVILVGVVVNDAILKVDLMRRLVGDGTTITEAIHIASRRRYRPILMTTATTSLALVPLFFGAGSELRAPLAATVIGGLVSATILTLIVIPAVFRLVTREVR